MIGRSITATDECGNSITFSQGIIVKDLTPPSWSQEMPANITVDCGDVPAVPENIAATDLCDPDVAVYFSETGTFDICGYEITRTWVAADDCENSITHVQAITVNPAPQAAFIDPPQDITISCDVATTSFEDSPLSYTNSGLGGCLIAGSVSGVITGTYDECGGTLYQTWTFTDECNRLIQHVQTIIVSPAPQAEFINPPGDITLSCDEYPSFQASYLAYSNASAGRSILSCLISGEVLGVISGDYNACGGSLVQTWTFTDECGRTITYVQNITLYDNTPPVIVDINDIMVYGCNAAWPDAPTTTFTDNCTEPYTLTGVSGGVVTDGCYQYIDYAFNVTDDCDNDATEVIVRVSRMYDVTVPVFAQAPAAASYQCIGDVPAPGYLGWTDNCSGSGEVLGVDVSDGNTCPETITRTWSYTDACGNPASVSQIITVDDQIPPALTNSPPSTIVAECGTLFELLPWQLPEWTDNCGLVIAVSDITDPPSTAPLPATYTRTWTVKDACDNIASFTQTIEVPKCEQEYCTVTQFTLGSAYASFCDGTSSYDLMESLLQENGPLVVGLPANNRSFTVPVVGGAQCIIDRFPSWNNAFVLTGNYSCGNFGDLLQPDGRFNNTLLVEAITMQFNLWMTPALGELLLENSAFYIRSASGCGSEDDYPLDDSTYYEIPPSVYSYLGSDPTVQDLLDLANLALGSPVIPGPNAPTRAQIKYALKYINEAFENCGFIYFVPPLSNNIELVKTGTIIDNEPIGVHNAGDQVSYQFAVSNIGNLTFSSVYINDPMIAVNGGPINNMAPGATDNTTFSGVYTITQEDIDAGSLSNTAMVIGLAGVNAYYDTDDDVQTFIQAPSIGLVKTGTFVDNFPLGIYNAGDQIVYTFDITNTGNVTLTDVALSDPLADLSGNAIEVLTPGMTNSSAYSAVYTLTEPDIAAGSFTNTAFVTGYFGTTPVTASAEDTQAWSQPPMIEVCTLTEEGYSDQFGEFCNGQTIYDLIESLMYPDDPLLLGLPANGRTFSVPVDGGAQCIMDILPGEGFANKLTGNWGCGNFGYLLNNDGKLYNTLLSQMIALELNMRLSPGLADVVLTSPEFYTRASSACGGGTSNGSYPLDDSLHFVIPYSVYLYLGINPTIQDVYELANSALGGVAPPPNLGPTLSDIRDAVQVINQAFEDCRFIFFIPKPKSSLVLPLGNELPVGIELKVAPNPFRSFTEVSFSVDKDSRVQAQLYDMQGNLVKTLFEGNMEAGQERTEVYNVSRNESFAMLICVIRTPTAIRVQRIIRAH